MAEIDNRVYEICQGITQAIKDTIFSKRLDASGNLSNSIETYFDIEGETYSVIIELADYWKYVEDGRRPGKFPPPNQIKDWIRFKRVVPSAKSSRKVPSTDQLAYLIGRKIATQGTKATHFLSETLESPKVLEMLGEIEDLVADSFVKEINEEIDKI